MPAKITNQEAEQGSKLDLDIYIKVKNHFCTWQDTTSLLPKRKKLNQ